MLGYCGNIRKVFPKERSILIVHWSNEIYFNFISNENDKQSLHNSKTKPIVHIALANSHLNPIVVKVSHDQSVITFVINSNITGMLKFSTT